MRWPLQMAAFALVTGALAAMAWAHWAEPAYWELTEHGLIMDESGSLGQFGAVVAFILVALVGGLALGAVIGFTCPSPNWTTVVVTVAWASAAGIVAWQLGIAFGPPDPIAVHGATVGDHIPARLSVDVPGAFFTWPVAATVGMLAGLGLNRRDRVQA